MKEEVLTAVMFFIRFIEKSDTFPRDQLENFKRHLTELLIQRFDKHWFPDLPARGQGYRCIRVNGISPIDLTLAKAATRCGLHYSDLRLPTELTVWVDPSEVCYRLGESEGSYCTLATFPSDCSLSSSPSSSLLSSSSSTSSSTSTSPSSSPPATPLQDSKHHSVNNGNGALSANRKAQSHSSNKQHAMLLQQRYHGNAHNVASPLEFPASPSGKYGRSNNGNAVALRTKHSPREMNFNFNSNRAMYRCEGPPYPPMTPPFYRNMNYNNRTHYKNVLRV